MRLVCEAARLLGAERLIEVTSAHIDGALYHGDSGTLFAEHLVAGGAKVAVRSTLNVGALDLAGCCAVRLAEPERTMARRLMDAYLAMGCEPSWTCAPYQAGHRPALGAQVAWGESNAVVFCNSVLGARTNRYGDFLDIACAITGRAPATGLHLDHNRLARFVFDLSTLPRSFLASHEAWPVLGSLYGREAGEAIGLVTGVEQHPGEDALKAFGAAAASTGAVALFHIAGVTPEAREPRAIMADHHLPRIEVSAAMVEEARRMLDTASADGALDAVGIGSPHLSADEIVSLDAFIAGRKLSVPIYACTGRHALSDPKVAGVRGTLEAAGVILVVDTCIAVTPILPTGGGTLMTNSGKFAQYLPGNTGHGVLYASLKDCVESAVAGRVIRTPIAAGET
jgi:predicted aconitase